METLVSIIIPIYNIKKKKKECIQSACKQDYDNIEIILVDDGAVDDSGNKCDIWAERDSRIRVIHKENGGLSSARNAGLDIAKGKYIFFLDGDDTIESDLISTVVQFMDQGEDIVFFRHFIVSPNGEKEIFGYETGKFELITDQERVHFFTYYILAGRLGWEAWNKLYRRDIIEENHLRFVDNKIIFAEDLCFCLCYCAHVNKIISINKCLYNYIQRSDSIMAEQADNLNIGRMNELAKKVLEYFERLNDCSEIINCFPLIYFMIIDNVLTRARQRLKGTLPEFRSQIYADVKDVFFMKQFLGRFLRMKNKLYAVYPGNKAASKISYAQYLYDGNYLTLRIRNRIINHSGQYLNRKSVWEKNIKFIIQQFSRNQNCIYFLGSEEYGNIGDHKIAEAIQSFAARYFPNYQLLEITCRDYSNAKFYMQKYIKRKDIIFLTGGGNLGDAYPTTEKIRQDIILTWKENLKVVFPQTIDFSETDVENECLKGAMNVYLNKNNVILSTREKTSFQIAKKLFECDVLLVPDIVLSCDEQKREEREKNVLFCFRNDQEKTMDEGAKDRLKKEIVKEGYEIKQIDLQLLYDVNKGQRKEEIEQKLEEIRKTSLVITDRLHGMVFSAITATPCIAFSNYNHKIKGTYEWLSYLTYIKYAENEEQAVKEVQKLLNISTCKFDNEPLIKYYEQLANVIRECIR